MAKFTLVFLMSTGFLCANSSELSRGESLDIRLKEYCSGAVSYYKIFTSFMFEFTKGSVTALVTWHTPVPESAMTKYSKATILAAAATNFINNLFDIWKVSSKHTLELHECLKQVHKEVQENSETMFPNLSKEMQDKVTTLDSTIAQRIYNKQSEDALKCLKRREEVYLSLPMSNQIKNVAQYDKNGDVDTRKDLDTRVDNLVAEYPDNFQEPLNLFIQAIRDNSIMKDSTQVQAFLYGPAGTGKTWFVDRLAETLDLPICHINLSKIEPSDLLGDPYEDALCQKKTEEVAGRIGSCFLNSGVLNPIIFFDEAGEYLGESAPSIGFDIDQMKKQLIKAVFKNLLDQEKKTLKISGLGISVDTSRATFVFASNYPLTDPTLLSRVQQINFDKLTRTEKQKALQRQVDSTLEGLKTILSEEETDKISETTNQYLEFVLDSDIARNPGARIIQAVVKDLIQHVRILLLKESATNKDDIEKFILSSFSRRSVLDSTLEKN